ncbi:NGP1NT-domain-containing protein [Piedraia hortae CBS 480.64]|uniref:Nucleolar GTP-binding protein 2 n=1 Tax=Piedraia hortae CBS 480.64 TaxID=1314780 RepID=A0A6A7C1F1_9PEZI|nr:NGP1NT-domain-containing protein [Piedraia hortae CBS 480.64]
MGNAKKEASRKQREGKTGDGMGNVRTKGENHYRSAKKVKQLGILKEGKPQRNSQGKITQAASYQGREKPNARIEPHRKWFTNSRVISQDALSKFQKAIDAQSKDPYSYVLKQNKLPMSLIHDNKDKERVDGLLQHRAKILVETQPYADTFGPKARRKRPTLAVSSVEEMAAATDNDYKTFLDRQTEAKYLAGQSTHEEDDSATAAIAREPVFSKGQSKRIWNELYKVIDSSDVIIHVLDARDPLGTRCRSVEKYMRQEAPHKHLVFLLNKCDLVPNSIAAKWVKYLSQEYPTLAFHASINNSFGKGTLISLLRQFSSLHSNRKQISVGFIGYPNTGKSSIINTLRKKKVCTTAPIPGETKVWQYITLMKRIYLIDCPGIVPPSMNDSPEDILLRGVVRVENVENPAQYIPAVLARCRREHLEKTYDVKLGSAAATVELGETNVVGTPATLSDKERLQEAIHFLDCLARKSGRLLKGGEADMDGVAKLVLNDFLRGKIPWYTPLPEDVHVDGKSRGEQLGFTHKRKRELEAREDTSKKQKMESDDQDDDDDIEYDSQGDDVEDDSQGDNVEYDSQEGEFEGFD